MIGSDKTITDKSLRELGRRVQMAIKQLRPQDINGHILFSGTHAVILIIAYRSHNYESDWIAIVYLFWYLATNFHARLNNQVFLLSVTLSYIILMYLRIKFRDLIENLDQIYAFFKTSKLRIGVFKVNRYKALNYLIDSHMTVTEMTVKVNKTLKNFYFVIYFFGSFTQNLLIILAIYGKSIHIKVVCINVLILVTLAIYVPTYTSAQLSKTAHRIYCRLNSVVCHQRLRFQIKWKVI